MSQATTNPIQPPTGLNSQLIRRNIRYGGASDIGELVDIAQYPKANSTRRSKGRAMPLQSSEEGVPKGHSRINVLREQTKML